jgi:hypothetical protein
MNVTETNTFVMVSTPDAYPHPWRYARVLKIFHVDCAFVDDTEQETSRCDVLWVRWFETDPTYPFGAAVKRLERVRYLDWNSEDACGFIDPEMVIRTVHMYPAYTLKVNHVRHEFSDSPDGDWNFHFVNR